ncbi:pentapeptide repeat-containing protein [Streptomyces sp. NPDC006654]|uniref:pentapeptide repeat-containing protein n=1 Tax=Streptomyces sp. NPDC006654 TaxID=3156897 RepID=UPI0033F6A7DE
MKPQTKRIALAAILTLAVTGYALLLWRGPWWIDGTHLRTKNLQPADGVVITGFRTMLVALGAGAVAALGLYYTHKGHKQTEALFEHTRKKDREQVALAREGQVTDRYVEAIKLLSTPGADGMMARIGGIYSLERIMRDSDKDLDTAVQVLAAFVRKYAPAPDADGPGIDEPDPDVIDLSEPSDDVQAALAVLMRRRDGEERPLDLSFTDLRSADLSGGKLMYANLTGSRLDGADLSGALLHHARLGAVDFTHANLSGADLRNADLVGFGVAAHISAEQLLQTEFDTTTRLPDRLQNHPAIQPAQAGNVRLFKGQAPGVLHRR